MLKIPKKTQSNNLLFFISFVAVLALPAYYTFLSAKNRYLNLEFGVLDFTMEHQVIHNTANGNFFGSSLEVNNYLGDHTSYLNLLTSLFYKLVPTVDTILWVQITSVVIACGFLGLIAFRLSGSYFLGLILVIISYFYGGFLGPLIEEYHPVVLAAPFLASGIYFYLKNNFWLSGFLLFLVALAKEEMGLMVASFGFFIILSNLWHHLKILGFANSFKISILLNQTLWFFRNLHKSSVFAVFLMIFGISFSLFNFLFVIPTVKSIFGSNFGSDIDTLRRYTFLTDENFIQTVFYGSFFNEYLLTPEKLNYLYKFFSPGMFLSFFSIGFIATLPNLLINILVDPSFSSQYSLSRQYDIAGSIFMWFSVILGTLKIRKLLFINKNTMVNTTKNLNFFFKKNYFNFIALGLLFTNLYTIASNPIWTLPEREINRFQEFEYIKLIQTRIPKDKIVAVQQTGVGSLFGEYKNLQMIYPRYYNYKETPEYIFLEKNLINNKKSDSFTKLMENIKNCNYAVFAENNRIVVYQKTVENCTL